MITKPAPCKPLSQERYSSPNMPITAYSENA
jgi:hypothetical protein